MTTALIDKIVNSVLYEGYMLYPYRNSSIKNRQRWNFGIVYPQGYNSEPSTMTTECLVEGGENAQVGIEVRFLHALETETVERRVHVPVSSEERNSRFSFDNLAGKVEVGITLLAPRLSKFRIHISNETTWRSTGPVSRDEVLRRSLISTHTILTVKEGSFISLLDPPEQFRQAALGCSNVGTWPVLVGRK